MNKYDLKQDHAEIKKQIKEWEARLDAITQNPNANITTPMHIREELEDISHEMMSINL